MLLTVSATDRPSNQLRVNGNLTDAVFSAQVIRKMTAAMAERVFWAAAFAVNDTAAVKIAPTRTSRMSKTVKRTLARSPPIAVLSAAAKSGGYSGGPAGIPAVPG